MKLSALIIFDMDGVLVDVSGSYREAVRQTVKTFFRPAPGSGALPDPLFSLADLAAVKQSGGLNNDWDLTAAILHLLFSRVRCPAALAADVPPWSRYDETIARCDVSELARFLETAGRPLAALLAEAGRFRHGFVTDMYTGDVGSGNVIKQIFQEIYLGRSRFESIYGIPAKIRCPDGLISREKLLVAPEWLERLAARHTLAIATGRPGVEADVALDHFGIRRFFSAVFHLDDCRRQEEAIRIREKRTVSLSKPDPYMLDAIAATVGRRTGAFYYVGDMPDDMVAAKRSPAGFHAVGILVASPDKVRLKQDLIQAGADHVVDDFTDLERLIDGGGR